MADRIVELEITGPGWADLKLKLGERRFILTSVSYCSDAIGDLARFALQIATGAEQASASFDREPAEWRLIAQSLPDMASEKGPVQISVYEFPNMQANAPLEAGGLAFRGDCDALAFARAVLSEIKRILPRIEEFTTGLYPVPTSALRALEAVLAKPGP
jgi:hypothetical protein